MATTYYSMIFIVPPSELPAAFPNSDEVGNFIAAHIHSDLHLQARSRHGAVFAELEKRVAQFALPSLYWAHPFVNPDQDFESVFTIKRIPSHQFAPLCHDIDALYSVARSSPRLFEITTIPELEKQMYDDFSQEVNSDVVLKDLTGYDENATWDLLFAFLGTVRSICDKAKSENKAVIQVCVWG